MYAKSKSRGASNGADTLSDSGRSTKLLPCALQWVPVRSRNVPHDNPTVKVSECSCAAVMGRSILKTSALELAHHRPAFPAQAPIQLAKQRSTRLRRLGQKRLQNTAIACPCLLKPCWRRRRERCRCPQFLAPPVSNNFVFVLTKQVSMLGNQREALQTSWQTERG